MGSFLYAVVGRVHSGEEFVKSRSHCDYCKKTLAWYDLVPVFSWLSTLGRCRYCHKKLAASYPIIELITAGLFVLSYVFWPYSLSLNQYLTSFSNMPLDGAPIFAMSSMISVVPIVLFILWLIFIVFCLALVIYDLRWMLLPDIFVYPLVVLGAVFGFLKLSFVDHLGWQFVALDMFFGLCAISGLYFVLYTLSKGKWVGFGDIKLGVFIGLALGGADSMVVLVLANLIGTLIIVPGLLAKKLDRKSKVPFGPFLIAGFLITGLFGDKIIDWYLHFNVLFLMNPSIFG
jgi:prepilin signal peptidase PulO-like enzyme (type II secretory pathway)